MLISHYENQFGSLLWKSVIFITMIQTESRQCVLCVLPDVSWVGGPSLWPRTYKRILFYLSKSTFTMQVFWTNEGLVTVQVLFLFWKLTLRLAHMLHYRTNGACKKSGRSLLVFSPPLSPFLYFHPNSHFMLRGEKWYTKNRVENLSLSVSVYLYLSLSLASEGNQCNLLTFELLFFSHQTTIACSVVLFQLWQCRTTGMMDVYSQ